MVLRYFAPDKCPTCSAKVVKDQRLGGFAYGLGADQRTYDCGLVLRFHRARRKDIQTFKPCPVGVKLARDKKALTNKIKRAVSMSKLPKADKKRFAEQLANL